MKKLLLCLLMAIGTAHAATVAESRNKGGGKMVLTDIKCSSQTGYVAYSVVPNQSTLGGCWFVDDQFVHIRWSDGDYRAYPIENWEIKQDKKPRNTY